MDAVKKRMTRQADGTYVLVAVNPPTKSRPVVWWLGRLVHLFEGFDVLSGYVNIHTPMSESLRWRGYAYAIIFLPWGWRLRWYWFVDRRWPVWDWEHFPHKQHNNGGTPG